MARHPSRAGDGALAAENAVLAARVQRLGSALTGLVHDISALKRENAALRSENLRLRTQLAPRADGRVETPGAVSLPAPASRANGG